MPLSLRDAVGQLICPTLYHGRRQDNPSLDASLAQLERYGWGGYIVFLGDHATLRSRLAILQQAARVPLLVAADLEQGAGQHLLGRSVFPPAMAFGATGNPDYAYALGAVTAAEALETGVNWVLAPVADVTVNPLNPIISLRSFGGLPQDVAAFVQAYVRGVQDFGALACAKHFPGHGDTTTDSHTALGRVEATAERLAAIELPPFRAAIATGVASIMTCHLQVPTLDATGAPATLSRPILTGLLREAWGYDGLVVTDAMGMGGLAGQDPAESAIRAIAAGCDVLLMPPDPVGTFEAVLGAVESGRLDEGRVREAAGRVLAAKARFTPATRLPPRPADALATEVARQAVTLAAGTPNVGPRTLAVAVDDGAEAGRLETWRDALAARGLEAGCVVHAGTPEGDWRAIAARAAEAESLLLGLFSPIRPGKDRSVLPESLLAPLRAIAGTTPTTVVSFSSPYLVCHFPDAAWVLSYGARPAQIEAAVAAVCGEAPMPGRQPVALPNRLGGATTGRQDPEDRSQAFA